MTIVVGALVPSMATSLTASAATAHRDRGPHYYLALGDSLSVGVEADVPTDRGYVDRVYSVLRQRDPSLQLRKLGCGGESTDSMIVGDPWLECTYGSSAHPIPSQLAAAIEFLRTHRGKVDLITLNIGANDLVQANCQGNTDCVNWVRGRIRQSLRFILWSLRSVAPEVRIVAMDIYNPVLGAWFMGPDGQAAALQADAGLRAINEELRAVYTDFRIPVAPVGAAFSSYDLTTVIDVPGYGSVPLGAARACQWTLFCEGQGNFHPNDEGYRVIGDTVLATVDQGRPLRR